MRNVKRETENTEGHNTHPTKKLVFHCRHNIIEAAGRAKQAKEKHYTHRTQSQSHLKYFLLHSLS